MPLPQPPLDDNGKVQRHDCVEIPRDAVIIRRISTHCIVSDVKAPSGKRLSSAAFKESSPKGSGMSVDLEILIIEAQINPREFVTTPRWMGSIFFTAGALRDLAFDIGPDPILEGEFMNPYHAEVWGDFNKNQVRNLPIHAQWYVRIEGVDIYPA